MLSVIDPRWWRALGVIAGALLVGTIVRVVVVHRLSAWFAKTSTDLDDIVLAATRRHLPLWFLLAGSGVAARIAPLEADIVQIVDRVCAAAFVLSLSLVIATLGTALLGRFTNQAGTTVATTSLAQNVLRGVILLGGGLLVLANLGVSITPLLTALGVTSLAVALALQPTLSNLFAGVHLAAAEPIRIGDFVELENGSTGFVQDIGWRATRVRELPNNIIIVPNARLVEMVVKNYTMPEPEQAALVQVGVAYGSDLDRVERVTIEVGREVLRAVQGGVAGFEPFIRYHTFGDSSIDFTVILRVQQYTDRFLVTHEFIRKLKQRYDREGIEIPFPQRVLHGAARPG